LDAPVGPVVLVHVVTGPVSVQVRVPLGVAPPLGPVTLAVKVTLLPSVGLVGKLVTATEGLAMATVKLSGLEVTEL
jgi:hypothetical protein